MKFLYFFSLIFFTSFCAYKKEENLKLNIALIEAAKKENSYDIFKNGAKKGDDILLK